MEKPFYLWTDYFLVGGITSVFVLSRAKVFPSGPSPFSHCVWSKLKHPTCISLQKRATGQSELRFTPSESAPSRWSHFPPQGSQPSLGSLPESVSVTQKSNLHRASSGRALMTEGKVRPQRFSGCTEAVLTVKNNTGTVRMTATMTASRTVRMRTSSLLWYLWRRSDCTFSKMRGKEVWTRNKAPPTPERQFSWTTQNL